MFLFGKVLLRFQKHNIASRKVVGIGVYAEIGNLLANRLLKLAHYPRDTSLVCLFARNVDHLVLAVLEQQLSAR